MASGQDSGRGASEGGDERNTGNDVPSLFAGWRKEGQVSGEEDSIKGGGGQRMQTDGKKRERLEELEGKGRAGYRETTEEGKKRLKALHEACEFPKPTHSGVGKEEKAMATPEKKELRRHQRVWLEFEGSSIKRQEEERLEGMKE